MAAIEDHTVRTERLLLRRWRAEDAEPLAAINRDPRVMEYIGTGVTMGRGLSDDLLARFEREWRERGFGIWAVEELEAPGVLAGFCGLTVPMFLPAVLPAVEVGWRLAFDAWGRGIATEAGRAALRFGFERAGMQEIIAIVDPRNERSLRVCEKLGMAPRPDRLRPRADGTSQRLRVFAVELQ